MASSDKSISRFDKPMASFDTPMASSGTPFSPYDKSLYPFVMPMASGTSMASGKSISPFDKPVSPFDKSLSPFDTPVTSPGTLSTVMSSDLPAATTPLPEQPATPPTCDTIESLVASKIWATVQDTPTSFKNPLFDRFLTELQVVSTLMGNASVRFCPGLLEVLSAPEPPGVDFFKNLPGEDDLNVKTIWGVYALVLEKDGHRPKVYTGGAIGCQGGVAARWYCYDFQNTLPELVEEALNNGFMIVSKGLLCWHPIPRAASVPIDRLINRSLEATLTYLFWTIQNHYKENHYKHHNMKHICPWDLSMFEYEGICTHCCLPEGIPRDFDLTAEQLEANAIQHEEKRVELKKINAQNWHFKQMETNYASYMDDACRRSLESRARNPERDLQTRAARATKAVETKRYHCTVCNISYTCQNWLTKHLNTEKHKRKVREQKNPNPFFCRLCNLGYSNKGNFTRHLKNKRHKKAAAEEAARKAATKANST